jgi:hypothetical protein
MDKINLPNIWRLELNKVFLKDRSLTDTISVQENMEQIRNSIDIAMKSLEGCESFNIVLCRPREYVGPKVPMQIFEYAKTADSVQRLEAYLNVIHVNADYFNDKKLLSFEEWASNPGKWVKD